MIDHYALHEINKLTDRFQLSDGLPKGIKPRYNISPTQPAPVIITVGDKTELHLMQWGLLSQGSTNTNSIFRYKTFNTASEKVFTKPSWSVAVRKYRCIVPANGFYLWRAHDAKKDAYYCTSSDQSLLGLAGIYSSWNSPNGIETQSFSLLTAEANDTMPHDVRRMPIILRKADEVGWRSTGEQDFSSIVEMMRPQDGVPLQLHQVSSDVSSAKIDAARLISPV